MNKFDWLEWVSEVGSNICIMCSVHIAHPNSSAKKTHVKKWNRFRSSINRESNEKDRKVQHKLNQKEATKSIRYEKVEFEQENNATPNIKYDGSIVAADK